MPKGPRSRFYALALTIFLMGCSQAEQLSSLAPDPTGTPAEVPTLTSAQGLQIELTHSGRLVAVDQFVYSLDQETAAKYFSNHYTGAYKLTCTGSRSHCSEKNLPKPPSAPAPLASKLTEVIVANKCSFARGESLSGATYTQNIALPGKSGKGVFNFNYQYKVVPISSPVTRNTAWVLDENASSLGNGAAITLGGEIMSLSASRSSDPSVGTQYTFGLRDDNGDSKVKDLELVVNGVVLNAPTHTLLENCTGCVVGDAGAVDFKYSTNAASSGEISLLPDSGALGEPSTAADARTLLRSDNNPNNDDGGATGAALAKARINPYVVSLRPGSYTIDASASVNELIGTKRISLDVTLQELHTTPGCE